MKKRLNYIALLTSFVIIGLDQLFKYLAKTNLKDLPWRTFPLIEDFFHLTYVENRGAAFGMLNGKAIFLITVTSAVLIGLIVLLISNKVKSPVLLFSISGIIGGGIGNLIDRVFRKYVIDYLDFRAINFAVFNFADCCIVVGTCLVLIYMLFFYKEPEKEANAQKAEEKND